jgi:phosphate transport system permease protein
MKATGNAGLAAGRTVRGLSVGRHLNDLAWRAAAGICAVGVAAVLLMIMGYIVREGVGALSFTFLTSAPHPVGVPGGGVGNGIAGTLIIVGIAAVMAFPIGIFVGVYLAVYGHGRIADTIRFLSDVLASVPSIAVGLFAYTLLVQPFRHFSAFSASFAFAILMMPLVIRTTEGALRLLPPELRESAVALGASDYQVTTRCLLVAARPGIVTGLLLALARVTGETAPLLFTAFGSQFWQFNPSNPMAELSLQIFTYAISPYRDWHQQAWAGALVLILAVSALGMIARVVFRQRHSVGG